MRVHVRIPMGFHTLFCNGNGNGAQVHGRAASAPQRLAVHVSPSLPVRDPNSHCQRWRRLLPRVCCVLCAVCCVLCAMLLPPHLSTRAPLPPRTHTCARAHTRTHRATHTHTTRARTYAGSHPLPDRSHRPADPMGDRQDPAAQSKLCNVGDASCSRGGTSCSAPSRRRS